jgi:natural product precursor
MKKLGKIHFRTIEEGLSESEMKFVVGGNYGYGYGGYGGGDVLFKCAHEYSGGDRETPCFMSLNMAIAFCSFYAAMDYKCTCFPC